MKNNMFPSSEATRSLLKYSVLFAYLAYLLYSFVTEYLRGESVGFTFPVFMIGVLVLGGGTVFLFVMTLRAWKRSQQEAAAAIDAKEESDK